jgi:hypothetical protein
MKNLTKRLPGAVLAAGALLAVSAADARAQALEKLTIVIFTPPSLGGSIEFPGPAGGPNWGSVAIDQAGYRIAYTPEALVHHKVHESRVSREWVLERTFWGGISSAIIERHRFGRRNKWCKTTKYLLLIPCSAVLVHFFQLIGREKYTFFWRTQQLFSRAFLGALWTGHAPDTRK